MKTLKTHFIVQTAGASMPTSCWGRYGRVAVLEVEKGVERASMISEHARDVVRVVATWERQHIGTTDRGAFQRAEAEAHALRRRLEAEREADEALADDPIIGDYEVGELD